MLHIGLENVPERIIRPGEKIIRPSATSPGRKQVESSLGWMRTEEDGGGDAKTCMTERRAFFFFSKVNKTFCLPQGTEKKEVEVAATGGGKGDWMERDSLVIEKEGENVLFLAGKCLD